MRFKFNWLKLSWQTVSCRVVFLLFKVGKGYWWTVGSYKVWNTLIFTAVLGGWGHSGAKAGGRRWHTNGTAGRRAMRLRPLRFQSVGRYGLKSVPCVKGGLYRQGCPCWILHFKILPFNIWTIPYFLLWNSWILHRSGGGFFCCSSLKWFRAYRIVTEREAVVLGILFLSCYRRQWQSLVA